LLARVIFAYTNADSFRDYVFNYRTMVNPALTYVWDENSAITFEFQYLADHRTFDTGVPALGGIPTTNPALLKAGVGLVNGNPALVPIERFVNQPTDFQSFTDYKTALTFVHNFDDCWSMRLGGFIGWHASPSFTTTPILFGNDPSLAPFAFVPPPFG